MGFAFYSHKARILLKRLSRTSFIGSKYTVEMMVAERSAVQKKVFEIPIFSNGTMVLRGWPSDFASLQNLDDGDGADFDKFYKISEKLDFISEDHQDAIGFKSLYAIKNIDSLPKLK